MHFISFFLDWLDPSNAHKTSKIDLTIIKIKVRAVNYVDDL